MIKYIFLIIFIFHSMFTFAQTKNEILAAELDIFIQNQMSEHAIPGLSASIVKEGQVVWKSAYGMSNIETNTPVTLGTEFTLASISKLFTATACAQLWEDGSLDIDENINTYLPFTVINPNFPDVPITVRQLLQHKSSLRDSENDLQLWDEIGDPMIDLSTFCNSYFVAGGDLYLASNFGTTAPGSSGYWYSNAGFTLLGYIVEEVSGTPFNHYCQMNILEPLQMNTAGWFYADIDEMDVAMPYDSNLQPYGYYSVPEYPAAMLKANVEELSNFLIAYTQSGTFQGSDLVNSTTFASIVPENMTKGFAWWGKDTWWGDEHGNFWSHGGYMNGVRTQLNYYPNDHTGLIILTNGEGNYLYIQSQLEWYISRFQIENITSLQEIKTLDFSVFPNPISKQNILKIKFGDHPNFPIQVEIHDSMGNTIRWIETNESILSVDLSDFCTGMYMLSIIEADNLYSSKIVIH